MYKDVDMNVRSFRLVTVLTALILLTSCAKDGREIPSAAGGGRIRFEVGFAEQETRVSTDISFKCSWTNGDEIGIFAVRRASDGSALLAATGNYIHNLRLTYDKGTNTWNPDSGVELVWFLGSDVLDFYAYYPYSDMATDPTAIAFTVATDQTGVDDHNASDWLAAKANNGGFGYSYDNTVRLNFRHVMAMVQMQIARNMAGGEINATLNGVKTASTLNLGASDGPAAMTSGSASNISMYRVEQSDDANYGELFTFRALIPAQTLAAGLRIFTLRVDGTPFIDGLSASDRVFEAGGVYWLRRDIMQGGIR